MNPRKQGDLGELSAMTWLGEQGYAIYLPFGHSPDVDLIAERGGQLVRVQVKTTTRFWQGRWIPMVCTKGGNQSWSGVTKLFSPGRCDYLFVHVGDGRRWFIPSGKVEGTSAVALGGPKYEAYEIDPGPPLPTAVAA
jgi:hypothetical protein